MRWRCTGCDSCIEGCGCAHEICGGCYCSKERHQNVCDACHEYSRDHPPYLAKYGPDNVRATS